ncbi:endopeptidase La [Sphaerochaeta halotolerans]|jgi:ATP-dependent Lon protease|uniref:Lon protease n=1 Tax=Sphaerochaeta halotolerans TaxID=2293840 RepID=A0A372MHC8_9SPIR|nr:endopeptidase La [Sphaerochaeta halotolerans]MBG0766120.1 endopeptidase La [Spirochaetaceae bacterium]MDK2859019.1 ATP-dependent Lon protease [Sphaerochaeta sp.]MDN5333232.1 ATP-dependent Lon protease [Sphaerochaeta sp.]MXI85494.1 endopeptidase La [Sphaerochaeta halotolerans]RFU95162.1 endopeptidase La [Sphaerochaeta halotolerans]
MSEQELMPIEQLLPNNLFILPVTGNPVFPGLFTPLMITDNQDVEIVNQAIKHGGFLGLLLVKEDNDEEEYSEKNLYTIGTVAKIVKKIKLPDGGISIFISTLKRFETKQYYPSGPYLVAEVQYLEDIEDEQEELRAWTRLLLTEMKQLTKNNQLFSEEMRLNMVNIDHPGKLADFIASILNVERKQQQEILETLVVRRRIEKVLVFIKNEQNIAQVQAKIQARVNQKIEKNQREYFLREELKSIQQELGISTNPKTDLINRLKNKFKNLPLSAEAKETVDREMDRLEGMDPSSPEYSLTRTYLEIISDLPWKEPKPENFSIESARKILEHDHYGMKDVKDRILEFLAVRKKKQDTKGSIICLVGPPGVGKTSVGVSIARALKKEYFRFSVGGMNDESEIKGHRRTYIGAMPGKIVQGLRITKSKNPVFLIDEIDKMGVSYQGDPASALLEVLDPEQNTAFRDTYLDIPFDVSEVLFIVTANTLETIPRPLLDRMEIIQLAGYTSDEKLAIGKKYLVPKSLDKHGLSKSEIRYPSKILRKIADEYAREAGVRNFEKSLHKINRKVALMLTENPETNLPVTINEKLLYELLGQPIFVEDEILKADRPGMAIGLAWTSMGGDTLIIEAQNTPGKGEIKLTGQLGEVMQESVSIAHTWVKAHALERKIDPSWFEHNSIHLHVPEGATPKDGPSAGITMTVALYSLVTNQVIAPNLAMTGELSLKGKVMPIGGLKEKVLAAKRNKIKDIIIPQFNKRDLDKLDEQVTKGINFHLVGTIEEVLALAFPNDEKREAMQPILSPPNTSEAETISKAVALAVREALRER